MEPTPELLAALEEEDAEQARRMTPAQRFRAGGDLFDEACRWTKAGIRREHPEWSEAQVFEELRRRVGAEQGSEVD